MQLKKAPANRKILRKHTKHNRSKKKTNNQKKNKKPPNQQATQNRSVFWGDIKVTKQLWECQKPKYAKNCTKRCKKQRVHQCCEGGNYACNVLFNHIHIILQINIHHQLFTASLSLPQLFHHIIISSKTLQLNKTQCNSTEVAMCLTQGHCRLASVGRQTMRTASFVEP